MKARWLLVFLLAAASACADGTMEPGTGELADMPADQIGVDVRLTMTEDGVRRAVVHADTAYLYQGASEADLTGVRLTFFDDAGRNAGELTSRSGTFDMRANRMVSRGDVVLVVRDERGEPRRIETEELHFDVQADRVWSDVETVMHHEGRTFRGSSFESDTRFENLRVREARTEGVGTPPSRDGVPEARPRAPELDAPDTEPIR